MTSPLQTLLHEDEEYRKQRTELVKVSTKERENRLQELEASIHAAELELRTLAEGVDGSDQSTAAEEGQEQANEAKKKAVTLVSKHKKALIAFIQKHL